MKQTHPRTCRSLSLGAACLLVLAMVAAACGSDTTDRSLEGSAASIFDGNCKSLDGEVTIYSGRSENLMQPILDAFECETGVEVAVRWAGSTDLALLLGEEGDQTPADVFLSRSPGPVGFLEARGLLSTVDDDVLDLVVDQYRSSDESWVGFSGRKRVAVYNTDNVAAADLPATVFDLTDEAWRGRAAIPATNGSFLDWFTVFRGEVGDDVATQWLDDMVANDARYYEGNRSIVEAAGRGEVDIGLVNHYYNYQEAAALGEAHHALNHDFGDDVGGTVMITAASVTAASENTEQANELIAYLLSEPVQEFLTNETFEYPLAAGVPAASVLDPIGGPQAGTVDFDSLGGGLEGSSEIVDASGIANQ